MKKINKCLGCYLPLNTSEQITGYHKKCSQKLFDFDEPPEIDFNINDLDQMARTLVSHHLGITGVQQKISVDIEKHQQDPSHRLMIVGLWGNYILKPPTKQFPNVSIIEDLTMHMAQSAGIKVAKHGLVQLQSGELVYITQRFDRKKKSQQKIAAEDFCQLSELLTADKYSTSTEKAGKIILKYSVNPGLDIISFFEIQLFSYLSGNADMHLKNFSLIQNDLGEYVLSPAYDLLSTKLIITEDKEESALTINGKKAKLKKADFIALGKTLKMTDKSIENSFKRILNAIPEMQKLIKISFLSAQLKKEYLNLITERRKVLL